MKKIDATPTSKFEEFIFNGIILTTKIGPVNLWIHWLQIVGFFALGGVLGLMLNDFSIGMIVSAALWGSLLLHEAGHYLTIVAQKLPVQGLVLFGIGAGVVRDDEQAGTNKQQAAVAAAGPAVNLAIGLATMNTNGVLAVISIVNFALFLMNIIPWPPLDGHKILTKLAPEQLQSIVTYTSIPVLIGAIWVLLGAVTAAIMVVQLLIFKRPSLKRAAPSVA